MRNLRLILGIGLATLGLALVTGTGLAQDPVKISPKMYKVLLENQEVRVLDFHAKPGEKEPMHSHPAMVVYVLHDGKIRLTTPDGKSVERESKAGTAVWNEPQTHAYENLGPGEAHVVVVELKGKAAKAASKAAPKKKE